MLSPSSRQFLLFLSLDQAFESSLPQPYKTWTIYVLFFLKGGTHLLKNKSYPLILIIIIIIDRWGSERPQTCLNILCLFRFLQKHSETSCKHKRCLLMLSKNRDQYAVVNKLSILLIRNNFQYFSVFRMTCCDLGLKEMSVT